MRRGRHGKGNVGGMKKTLFGAVILLIALGYGVFRFYNSVQANEWNTHAKAAETVTQSTYMTHVDRVETFRGEQPYSIVFGTDSNGKEAIAWVGTDEKDVHMEYIADGTSEDDIRGKVLQRAPDAEIERILPGKLNGELVWEVFYKRRETDGVRYYYDYYRFKDGTEIDTWKLSKKK